MFISSNLWSGITSNYELKKKVVFLGVTRETKKKELLLYSPIVSVYTSLSLFIRWEAVTDCVILVCTWLPKRTVFIPRLLARICSLPVHLTEAVTYSVLLYVVTIQTSYEWWRLRKCVGDFSFSFQIHFFVFNLRRMHLDFFLFCNQLMLYSE